MVFPNTFVCGEIEKGTYHKPVPAPLFRYEFHVNTRSDASLIIGATGLYMLKLNGKDITKGQLAPFFSNPDDVVYYDQYNLSDYLDTGKNVLTVLLGNGTANPIGGEIWGHTQIAQTPSFSLSFRSNDIAFEAKDMLWHPSSILFDDLRCGVYCDARLDEKSWYLPNCDTSSWKKPSICKPPKGIPHLVTCEPVVLKEVFKAKSIQVGVLKQYRIRDVYSDKLTKECPLMGKTPLSGGVVYDFGENMSGVPILKIRGDKGQKIEMQFSELLTEGAVDYTNVDVYPDGCCQRDVYILNGEGDEIFIPPFTYHGARYCYVYGLKEDQIQVDTLTFAKVTNDVKRFSSFECSNPIANKIYDACIRSDESNLMYFITDCPQREKNGWTGDASISSEQLFTHFDVKRCVEDWLVSIRKSQFEDGTLPMIVPSKNDYDPCLIWDSALLELTYQDFIHTNSKKVIEDNIDAILQNLFGWYEKRDENGIVEMGLGDWLPPDTLPSQYDSSLGLCCSAVLVDELDKAASLCHALQMKKEEDECRRIAEKLRVDIRHVYDAGPGLLGPSKKDQERKTRFKSCQTSQVLGLKFHIFKKEEEKIALGHLIKMIHAKNDSFDTGFLGLRYIFDVLFENNEVDLVWKMITKPEHPSFANLIYRGETTLCERFSSPGLRVGSHNHHFMGDVSRSFIANILGIHFRYENDDVVFSFNPNLPTDLSYAKGWQIVKDKKAYVSLKRENDKIICETSIEKV